MNITLSMLAKKVGMSISTAARILKDENIPGCYQLPNRIWIVDEKAAEHPAFTNGKKKPGPKSKRLPKKNMDKINAIFMRLIKDGYGSDLPDSERMQVAADRFTLKISQLAEKGFFTKKA